jgi:hypothetical protein
MKLGGVGDGGENILTTGGAGEVSNPTDVPTHWSPLSNTAEVSGAPDRPMVKEW